MADAIEFFHNRHIGRVEGSKNKVIIDRVFFEALLNLRDRTGTAGSSSIVDNPVPTSQIAAGAVSQISAATTLGASSTGGSTNWLEIQSVAITTAGGAAIIHATAQIYNVYDYAATNNAGGVIWGKGCNIRVLRDGVSIFATECAHVTPGYRDSAIVYVAGGEQLVSLHFVDAAPTAAAHTYALEILGQPQWNGAAQVDAATQASVRTLSVTELKR